MIWQRSGLFVLVHKYMQRFRPVIFGVGGLFGLIVLLLIVGFFLPASYQVERSAIIHAPLDSVFNTIHDLKRWKSWNPWSGTVDDFLVHTSDKSTGVGAWQHWSSDELGSGMLKYIEVEEGRLIKYVMEYDMERSETVGWFTFEPVAEGVKVTWVDQGSMGNNPLQRYMCLFMEAMMGPDFEQGLLNVKTACE